MGRKKAAADSGSSNGNGAASLAGKKVVFTGKLASMTRSQAASYVTAAGGTHGSSVTKDLDYLVIGDDGSSLFGAGTKGEKTLAAEKLIANGSSLQIISETDFLKMAKAPAPAEPPKPKFEEGPEKVDTADDGSSFDPTGKKFMFTGALASMTREEAKARVETLGGIPAGSVSKDLDFLVVGDQGSHLFGAGAKGEKILKAEKLIANGAALKIISETAFMQMKAGGGGGKKTKTAEAAKPAKTKAATKAATATKAKPKAKVAAKKSKKQ